ncbi:aspartate aminotransferase family protein [Mesobacterium pallidum]|uniref:aspartate aminotransferase family protein n=1 Tax=Mesobacterium pallidum TaxID=2872037 RepID=UPI001EE25F58|nr:aspartate aminotransferase family protein [Mesobacterium pallidum]
MTYVLHRSTKTDFQVAVAGEGSWLTLAGGLHVLDASGGAAVACIGHGNRRVAEAIADQATKVAYVHTLFFSSEPAEELADHMIAISGGAFARAFFVSSGSESMDSAIKMGLQYHIERGEPDRQIFIARRQSYHGNTFGALAASGHAARRSIYEPVLMRNFSHVSPCFPYHYQPEGQDDETYVAALAAELEAEILRLGPANVAGFIAETIVGATSGCAVATPGYFKAVREICDRYGILWIADEIMCGMGRTGRTHAWEWEGASPDIQTVAKGLGGGYVPIGAMLIAPKVLEVLTAGTGSFVHGHTYQAHPVATRGALEVQRIITEQALVANVADLGPKLTDRLQQHFGQHPHVGEIRGRGFFQALEFVSDRESKTPFAPDVAFSDRLKRAALEAGLAIYPNGGTIDGKTGDHVIIAPPFNATEDELDQICDRLGTALDATVASLRG